MLSSSLGDRSKASRLTKDGETLQLRAVHSNGLQTHICDGSCSQLGQLHGSPTPRGSELGALHAEIGQSGTALGHSCNS